MKTIMQYIIFALILSGCATIPDECELGIYGNLVCVDIAPEQNCIKVSDYMYDCLNSLGY